MNNDNVSYHWEPRLVNGRPKLIRRNRDTDGVVREHTVGIIGKNDTHDPPWYALVNIEPTEWFDTEEDAKAWLLAVVRMA